MGKSRVFNRQLDPKLIGAKITRLRTEAGLGRKGLADAMGVAVTSVRAYEIGKVCPEYEHLLPIAQALGVARESLCIYSFSNIGEVLAALKSLCEDYGVMHLTSDEAQGPCCLIPTSEFMVQLFSDWFSAVHWCSPLLRRFLLRLWREDSCCCGRERLTQDFAQWYNGIILLKTIASSSQAQQDCRPSWAFLLSMTGFHTLPVLTACFPDEFAVIVAVIGKVYQSCW